jgi:hypothetical protein
MFVIWSRWGLIVPLLNFVAFMLYAFSLSPFEHKHVSALANVAIIGASATVFGGATAAGLFLFAQYIEKKNPPRVLIDEATSKRVVLRRTAGTFFFIPVRIWAFITIPLWGAVAIGGISGGSLL